MLNLGQVLGGRYRLDEEIGSGGMGSVFRGWHLVLDREVAIKVLHRHLAADGQFRARFLREPQMAARIRHPNIIGVHDASDDEDSPYIVMDYVDGGDLRGLIRAGRLDPARALDLVGGVAAALDAAHEHGLVHRDVKPANVLLGYHGVLLTDFGLAKLSSGAADMTRTGIFLGTPYYAAPEQFEGHRVDASADIYSLGCVLFECLSGGVPFAYDSEFRLGLAHREEEPPSLARARPELGTRLDAVIARALAKRPEDRYPSAGALVDDARAALGSIRNAETVVSKLPADPGLTVIEEVPLPALSASSAPTAPNAATPPPARDATVVERMGVTGPTLPVASPRRRARTPIVIAALVAVLALGSLGAALALSGGSKPAAKAAAKTTAVEETQATVTQPARPGSTYPTRVESTLLAAAGLNARTCKRAPRLAAFKQAAAVLFCTAAGKTLSYGIFPTRTRLDAAYATYFTRYAKPAGVGQDRARCGASGVTVGEGSYATKGSTAGRILCFRQGSSSWLVWTRRQPFVLSVARQSGEAAALLAWWSRAGRAQDPIKVAVVHDPTPIRTPTPTHTYTPTPTYKPAPKPVVTVPEPPSSVDVPEPPS